MEVRHCRAQHEVLLRFIRYTFLFWGPSDEHPLSYWIDHTVNRGSNHHRSSFQVPSELKLVLTRATVLSEECRSPIPPLKAALLHAKWSQSFTEILKEVQWYVSVVYHGRAAYKNIQDDKLHAPEVLGEVPWEARLGHQEQLLLKIAERQDWLDLMLELQDWDRDHECSVRLCGNMHGRTTYPPRFCLAKQLLQKWSENVRLSNHSYRLSLLWSFEDDPLVVTSGRLLGSGSFAAVIQSMWLGAEYAQKVFSSRGLTCLRAEAEALAKLNHPHIVKVYACSKNSLLLDLMSTDLQKFIEARMQGGKRPQPFSLPAAMDLMLQIADAVSYLHSQRMVHRDLKSSNILVDPVNTSGINLEDGYVFAKVADFGLAKLKHEITSYAHLTHNMGTTRFMAPEIFGANKDDEHLEHAYPMKADVYSFGVICYEIMSGEEPYSGVPLSLLYSKLTGETPLRPQLPASCPTPLASLICACWHGDPRQRPTFADVCRVLRYLKGIETLCEVRRISPIDATWPFGRLPALVKVEEKILSGPNNDLGGFLSAEDHLQHNVDLFTQNCSLKASDSALNHARNLLSEGMNRLADEFKALLLQHSNPVDPERLQEMIPASAKQNGTSAIEGRTDGANGNAQVPFELPLLVSPRVVPQLLEMVQRLVYAGYHAQCLKIYRDVRASTLEQSLRKLGVEKLSKEDVQKMQLEALEIKIGNWIQYMRISVKLLFASERKLCDQIWYHLDPHQENCFVDVAGSNVHMLLSFGEAMAKSEKLPEKLFVLLDMYETMHDLLPEIDIVFSSASATGIRQAAQDLVQRLAQTAKDTFGVFEDLVSTEASKIPVPDGTIHIYSKYVINYIKFLFDYQKTLNHLLGGGQSQPIDTPSPLAAAIVRIISALQSNLDGKSKLYRDPALTQLFLMNNIHYIVKYVRRSEARDILGDDWVQKQRLSVQQHAIYYQRATWSKALSCLSESASSSEQLSGGSSDGSGISKAAIREGFKNSNLLLEELYNQQTQWSIPDTELREAVRLQAAEVLVPAYRSFLSSIIESDKSMGKYVKYTPEDLERMVGKFFEGEARADIGVTLGKKHQSNEKHQPQRNSLKNFLGLAWTGWIRWWKDPLLPVTLVAQHNI